MIDLTDLIEHLLRLDISGHTFSRIINLILGFKQERLHLPFGEASIEIKKWTMLGTISMAATTGFTTFKKALDHGGVEDQ
jgi:hypothetical protein